MQPANPEVLEALQPVLQARNDKMSREFDASVAMIKRVQASDVVELDEYRFVNVFLDYFAGEKDLMYFQDDDFETAQQKAHRTWINVAQGPFNPVQVYRMEGGVKQVLFTVPATIARDVLKPVDSRQGEFSVANTVITAQNLTNYGSDHAERYLAQKLGERVSRMQNAGVRMAEAKMWNEIFSRYNKPLIQVTGAMPEGKKAAGPTNMAGEEVEGYDPA